MNNNREPEHKSLKEKKDKMTKRSICGYKERKRAFGDLERKRRAGIRTSVKREKASSADID